MPVAHIASQWQIDLAAGDFSAPVADTGEDPLNLVAIELADLEDGTEYKARLRHLSDEGAWSEYSDPVLFTTDSLDIEAPPGRVTRIPRPSLQNQTRLSHMAPPRLDNLKDAERHMQDLAHRLNRLIDDYNERQ